MCKISRSHTRPESTSVSELLVSVTVSCAPADAKPKSTLIRSRHTPFNEGSEQGVQEKQNDHNRKRRIAARIQKITLKIGNGWAGKNGQFIHMYQAGPVSMQDLPVLQNIYITPIDYHTRRRLTVSAISTSIDFTGRIYEELSSDGRLHPGRLPTAGQGSRHAAPLDRKSSLRANPVLHSIVQQQQQHRHIGNTNVAKISSMGIEKICLIAR